MSDATADLAEGRTAVAFGTPVASYLWPDSAALNSDLEELILARAEAAQGLDRSNAGGWHSTTDLLQWPGPAVATLGDRIARFVRDFAAGAILPGVDISALTMRAEGWANVSRDGDYHALHNHPGAHVSGVYYVSRGMPAPGPKANGQLELFDPRPGPNMVGLRGSIYERRVLFDPVPGLMVLFPSWLNHMVHPFRGDGARISISFNVKLTGP